tara:strand:- start:26 stop:610 length:585 start_codon:yes stop_codon:yes gene_type:complete
MTYDNFFASVIGCENNLNHKKIKSALIKKCYDIQSLKHGDAGWVEKPYTTFNSHNICHDKDFKKINKFVADAVKNYCLINSYDSNKIQTVPTQGWLNIYKKGDGQEYHTHPRSVISVIYFLKLPKDSPKVYFKPPFVDMIDPAITELTHNNMQLIEINPEEGSVIVFRSHLPHMVARHNSNEERISLAYNFLNF